MTTVETLQSVLSEHAQKRVAFLLPTGTPVPLHFHITELGLVSKEFVDCGGVRRSSKACMLQTWVANDTEHVLYAEKLSAILSNAGSLGIQADDQVECEYKADHMNTFIIGSHSVNDKAVVFQLADKQTQCLSPDRCGLDENGNPLCG